MRSLLNLRDFEAEVLAKLQSLNPRPDMVIGPSHPAATKLGAIAKDVLGAPFFSHNTLYIDDDAANFPIVDAAKSATTLLLIDDLLITGSRLDTYNRAIRENAHLFPNLERIIFFVMLALPTSDKELEQRITGLTSNHEGWTNSVEYLYAFPLPAWRSTQQCPWCVEETMLTSMAREHGELETPYDERLRVLQDKRAGVTERALHVMGGIGSRTLGSRSAILSSGSGPVQVLFACASAIQQKRRAPRNSLDSRGFPSPRYLGEQVFSKFYSERLIWICMLRSLLAHELDVRLQDYLLNRALMLNAEDDDDFVRTELAWAGLEGYLGKIPNADQWCAFCERAGLPLTPHTSVTETSFPQEARKSTAPRRSILSRLKAFCKSALRK